MVCSITSVCKVSAKFHGVTILAMSTTNPPSSNEREKDKLFACTSPGCNQKFSSAERLGIHKQKHQMTLKLGPSKQNLQDVLPVDQTPTPTRFLHLGNQMGLFDELKENPFDKDFKKAQKEVITPKQRRAAAVVQQLQIRNNNHQRKTPTTPGESGTMSQPVHVITLTPTLPSPVATLSGGAGQFFLPPLLPSPQGLIPTLSGYTATSPMQVPASLLSPTLMPFHPGLLPGAAMMADATQRAAVFTQAVFAAAASAASPLATTTIAPAMSTGVARVNSAGDVQASNANNIFQNHRNSLSMSVVLPKQERPMSVGSDTSNPMQDQHHPSSVITQVPPNAVHHPEQSFISNNSAYPSMLELSRSQSNAVSSAALSAMATNNHVHMETTTSLPSLTNLNMLPQHPVLAATHSQQSLSRTSSNEYGSTSNLSDATKQKLKDTLTSNNPNLQYSVGSDEQRKISSTSDSSSTQGIQDSMEDMKPTPRRRGRQQQDIDPDVKRQKFLERNRAAASRCRIKKKKWVCNLEVKAKGLTQLNVQLQNEIASLKDEIASLKQLLLSHRDCPITKMQQQSMAMAGINLNTLEPSTPSTINILEAAVKSESPVPGDNPHAALTSTLSSGSVDENHRNSTPNLSIPQVSQPPPPVTMNGQVMFASLPTSSSVATT